MALDQSALLEVLEALKAADVDDRIRAAATTIYQALIEAELTAVIGAGPHERTEARTAQRNGSRPRVLSTTAGDLELRIPKLRTGSFFPSLLERRRRIDQALFAVVMEAYLHGVSTRKVDDLVRALGADTGISRSEVSRICPGLDAEVADWRDRTPGEQALCLRPPRGHLLQAPGQPPGRPPGRRDRHRGGRDGRREVLGRAIGNIDPEAFWTLFSASMTLLTPPAPTAPEPRRSNSDEEIDQPAPDGIVGTTGEQHVTTYTAHGARPASSLQGLRGAGP